MPRRTAQRQQLTAKPGYSFADLLALTGATKGNLIHWSALGILAAGIEDTAGRGHHRRFSALNVIEVELAAAVNRFGVPADTIRGALNVFRHFHTGAVAVHGLQEVLDARPATTMPFADPPHLHLFTSLEGRARVARSFVIEQAQQAELAALRTQDDADRAVEHVKGLARVWAELRAGSLTRGVPNPPSWSSHFIGLFISGIYVDGDATFATVALDPRELRSLIEESAIVIDLANVVFRVGERCKRLGVSLEPW